MIATAPNKRTARYRRPWMAEYQLSAMFHEERYGLVEANTKAGKTVACIVWLSEKAMAGKDGQNFWWVAPVYGQAKIAFRRMKVALPRWAYVANESEQTITLLNGAVLWFKGSDKPDSLYGEDVFAAVIDEASRVKEDAWYAVRSTLTATRGPIRIIGNVRGRKNWFYRLARRFEGGEAGGHYQKITAWDAVKAGVLEEDEVLDAQRLLPEAAFRELYLAEPSEDGSNPFGLSAIRACIAPISMERAQQWGWDLAKSVDWTVGVGLDQAGYTAALYRFQRPWEDTIKTILAATTKSASVDSTGVGDPIVERLQRARRGVFEPYIFSSSSKQRLMEGLAAAIQIQEIHFPEGIIVDELEEFEYVYTRTGVRYCLAGHTRVLSGDLRWVPIDGLEVGDPLLAFDEFQTEPKGRKWRGAVVTDRADIVRPCYIVTLEDGTKITASQEHLWLVDTGQGPPEWRMTSQLRGVHPTSRSLNSVASRLVRLVDVWDEPSSYEAGYLAAAFDGEGTIQQAKKSNGGHGARLTFAQLENGMASQVRDYLAEFGYSWAEFEGADKAISFGLTGGRHEFLRFLGQIRPRRLLPKFDPEKLGTLARKASVKVASVEFIGDQWVVALGTSTKTLIAEGIASHNSAPDGQHDDTVMALGLAVENRAMHPVTRLGVGGLGGDSG